MRTQDSWARELLASTYAPMRCLPQDADEDVVISPGGDFAGAFYVLRDLFAAFASRVEDCVALYGASIAIGGRGVLLLGAATVGKSVLALNLAQYGARFLGDEIALLNLRDGTLSSVPRAAALREPGLPYLLDPAMRARVAACPRAYHTPRGRLWYALDRETLGVPIDARSYPLAGIYAIAERAAQSRVRETMRGESLPALTRRMHRMPQTLDELALLHKILRSVPAYELVLGPADQTAAMVAGSIARCA